VLSVNGAPASFAAAMYRGHPRVDNVWGLSRGVTLPDFQGLGLIFALIDTLGSVYKTKGLRLRSYPAHPIYVRAHDRSPNWKLAKAPHLRNSGVADGALSGRKQDSPLRDQGGRPNATFEYCGPAASKADAAILID
jgi:hypothetical protein